MSMDCHPIIEFEHVYFRYNGEYVLEDVSLHVHEREFGWIVGPNGGGKTTLVKLILGLVQPTQGLVRVFGGPPSAARGRIGYMPQRLDLDRNYPARAIDVVLMGRLGPSNRFGFYSREDRRIAEESLAQVGLDGLAEREFSELSGGQQRRLFVARALAVQPECLILDEPTANLDPLVQSELYKLLQKLNEKIAIVLISHDPAFVAESVEQVICVKKNVHVHPTGKLSDDLLKALYGPGDLRIVRHDVQEKGHPHD
ncbi:MAG TPA: metal ABC transporter ATP-binding protein [candidate division Zixibacteria bacterium]|nr:metal ABC transporter ATP-binding protein [candidate division Zixibacteria bacterium]